MRGMEELDNFLNAGVESEAPKKSVSEILTSVSEAVSNLTELLALLSGTIAEEPAPEPEVEQTTEPIAEEPATEE